MTLVALGTFAARGALAAWAAAVIAVGADLLAPHLLTLPKPRVGDGRIELALAATRAPEKAALPDVLHVLYATCRCSGRVLEHLVARGALPGLRERVVLVGAADAAGATDAAVARIVARGFEVESLTAEALSATYGALGAPLLVVTDVGHHVRYVGGYAVTKQSARFRDVEIIAQASVGEDITALPLFGCPVDATLQRTVDPLGIAR